MPKKYPSDKPYLVIRINRKGKEVYLIPKKTFNDFSTAMKYVKTHAQWINLHQNPAWSNDPVNLDDIREFLHGTKDW